MANSEFAMHIEGVCRNYAEGLKHLRSSGSEIDAVLLHSGSQQFYHGDDRGIPFQSYGHFLHWLPVNRPDQFVLFQPGARPIYFQVIPEDFWYEQTIAAADWWASEFEIVRLAAVSELAKRLTAARIAYLGGHTQLALQLNIDKGGINPIALLSFLDFQRAYKSNYELEQLREANRLAINGHWAARDCFLGGGNEYQIHMAFLDACNILEEESPYTNIVALDEKSAILHYQHKRRDPAESQVLLIDAGCRVRGYGSDVTRTWAKDSAHPVFTELLAGMQNLELEIVNLVCPGIAYPELHSAALHGIASLLNELGICDASAAQLCEQEVPQLFMPHGVGHLLGIQVHDVGGRQADIAGTTSLPPAHSPALRNTRTLTENMVFTIEPGCYFIPMLLEPQRNQPKGASINWSRVEELYPFGGIRIEDNVRVTASGVENLTRQFE
ncbi:MAG: Xaa-Pro dipeptidase [Proteobacteria bacterium]|nr:Xaa-Pro dipeptidase [Pseudomonadota bacterium]